MRKYIIILNWILLALVSFVFIFPIILLIFFTNTLITLPLFLIGSTTTFLLALIGIVLETLETWNDRRNLTNILRTPSAIILLLFLSIVIYYYILRS